MSDFLITYKYCISLCDFRPSVSSRNAYSQPFANA